MLRIVVCLNWDFWDFVVVVVWGIGLGWVCGWGSSSGPSRPLALTPSLSRPAGEGEERLWRSGHPRSLASLVRAPFVLRTFPPRVGETLGFCMACVKMGVDSH